MPLTQIKTSNLDSSNGLFFRNRIINGDMRIDQRNAGASINNTTSGLYSVDRWKTYGAASAKFSIQQNAGSVTPPAGFVNYVGVTSLSSYSLSAGDEFDVYQLIEGYNSSDLAWGTASAKTITLSFWVRSSLTGTHGGSIRNTAVTRSYPFTYTITAANTWEQKSIVIPGCVDGFWETTTSTGIILLFGMGVGSTYSGAAGSWLSGNYVSATGATSLVGTSGATWYITGVQLEVGTAATAFERRPYGTELQLCQRYYQRLTLDAGLAGFNDNTTRGIFGYYFPVQLRAAPTLTTTGTASNYGLRTAGIAFYNASSVPTIVGATVNACRIDCSVSSGLVQGSGSLLGGSDGATFLGFNSEL